MPKKKICLKNGNCDKKKCDNEKCEQPPRVAQPVTEATAAENNAVAAPAASASITDPAGAISSGAENFKRAYDQYAALRELARPLNGLSQAGELPANIKVKKITIEFGVNDSEYVAEIPEIKRIGDVAPLISFGLRALLERMHEELFSLEHVTKGMQKLVENAANRTPSSAAAPAVATSTTTVIPAKVNTVITSTPALTAQ